MHGAHGQEAAERGGDGTDPEQVDEGLRADGGRHGNLRFFLSRRQDLEARLRVVAGDAGQADALLAAEDGHRRRSAAIARRDDGRLCVLDRLTVRHGNRGRHEHRAVRLVLHRDVIIAVGEDVAHLHAAALEEELHAARVLRRCRRDVDIARERVGDGRFARGILAVLVELRHGARLAAVDAVAVVLHRTILGEGLALIRDRVVGDLCARAGLEFLRERLAGTAREHHREERECHAAVRDHSAKAQQMAAPADERLAEEQDGDSCEHKQPRGAHACEKRKC